MICKISDQFFDILGIVDRQIYQMNATFLKRPVHGLNKARHARDTVPMRAIGFGIFDEIWIVVLQPPVFKALTGLLPPDHAIGIVVQDQHNHIQVQPDSSFNLLTVHHEATIAADRHDFATWINHGCEHC